MGSPKYTDPRSSVLTEPPRVTATSSRGQRQPQAPQWSTATGVATKHTVWYLYDRRELTRNDYRFEQRMTRKNRDMWLVLLYSSYRYRRNVYRWRPLALSADEKENRICSVTFCICTSYISAFCDIVVDRYCLRMSSCAHGLLLFINVIGHGHTGSTALQNLCRDIALAYPV